jgi:hypothetical protein
MKGETQMTASTKPRLKVADEVWIATALLHRENPNQPDFSIEEIVARAQKEGLAQGSPLGVNVHVGRPGTKGATQVLVPVTRPGVYVHVVQHCVANRPPNPGRYRMLYETSPGRRRLFRPGDSYHPAREGAKSNPNREEMPYGYDGLISWYRDWCAQARSAVDPLLDMTGSGSGLWADEPADDYVRRLREGWE